jgi:tetratricopeptide (TPR) repeat protein
LNDLSPENNKKGDLRKIISYLPGGFHKLQGSPYPPQKTKDSIENKGLLVYNFCVFTFKKYTLLSVWIVFSVLLFQGCSQSSHNNQTPENPSSTGSQAPSPVASASQSPSNLSEADRLAEEGRKFQEKGDYHTALDYVNRALKIAPDRDSFYASRGLIHYQMKNYHLAFEDYNKALKMNPDSAMNYLNRGDAYLVLGRRDEAMQDYLNTVKIDPTKHGAWYHMGMIRIMRREYKQALKDTEKAISLLPKNDEGYQFDKGFILYKLERYDEALEALREVEKIAPEFDATYKQIGDVYVETGDSRKALGYYTKALELYPKNLDKWNRREMNLYQKDIDEAAIYLNRAIAYSNLGEYKEVVKDCENAIRSGSKEARVYEELASARHSLGDRRQAEKDAQKCLQLINFKEPGFRKYTTAYNACMVLGKYDKALDYNFKAMDELADMDYESRELIVARYDRACMYEKTGRYEEALKLFKEVAANKKEKYLSQKAKKNVELMTGKPAK